MVGDLLLGGPSGQPLLPVLPRVIHAGGLDILVVIMVVVRRDEEVVDLVAHAVERNIVKVADVAAVDLDVELDGALDGKHLLLVHHNVDGGVLQRGRELELDVVVGRRVVAVPKPLDLSVRLHAKLGEEQTAGQVVVRQDLEEGPLAERREEEELEAGREQEECPVARRKDRRDGRAGELGVAGLLGLLAVVLPLESLLLVDLANARSQDGEDLGEEVGSVEDGWCGEQGVVDDVPDTVLGVPVGVDDRGELVELDR